MLLNKRGAALLQVLIIAAILAGMSAMILRLTLSRTITSRQSRHVIAAQTVIESCMAEVNTFWAAKTSADYAADLAACRMCKTTGGQCTATDTYTCSNIDIYADSDNYTVTAKMESRSGSVTPPCKITYTITHTTNGVSDARQTL